VVDPAGQNLPNRMGVIMARFQTDYIVCGIAPLNDNLALLAYTDETVDDSSNKKAGARRVRARHPHAVCVHALILTDGRVHVHVHVRGARRPGRWASRPRFAW
jgi:hypothetical protein